MTLILFKLQLAIHLCVFLLEIIANVSKKTKPFVLGIFIILLLLGTMIILNSINKIKSTQTKILTAPTPTHPEMFVFSKYSFEELNSQLEYWKYIEEKQQNSRDVLINISKLNQALGNTDDSFKYWEKAKKIDPNFAIFK